ncbi:MAG: hypothetical protein AAGI51_10325 [Pseudomonadota bacterium]
MARIGKLGLCAALGAAAPTSAPAASARSLQLSTGHVIVMPPAEEMDCPALARKLDEIDRTGYRGRSPRPAAAADMPLLRYENEISNRYYSQCMRLQESGGARRNALFQAAPSARGEGSGQADE